MKLRKLMALSMAAVMAAGAVGCASDTSKEATQAPSQGSTETTAAAQTTAAQSTTAAQTETSAPAGQGVKLTMMNSKPELEDALLEAAKEFEAKTGVQIEIYTTDKPGEMAAQKYAAGDPPTILMCDYANVTDLAAEKLLDLSGEDWAKDGGEALGVHVNDKLYGFPFCVEATGVLYNRTAIENILGEDFDPSKYTTLDQFKELLEKLRAGGMENPMILNSEDWSIGQHFLQYIYRMHTGKSQDALAYLDEVRTGVANFEDDEVYNAIYDTLDTFIEYNINKNDPLAADYDLNASYLAEGEAAFWMNGSWAWPDTEEFVDGSMTYGIMAYPINGNSPAVGKVGANATKYMAIDNVKADASQQQAAKDFLNWLVYDTQGQEVLVNKCAVVPAFVNITLPMTNDYNEAVKEYVDKGLATEYVPIPSDHRSTLAAYMQKYLAGELDRAEMAQHLDEYWKSH